MLACKWKKNDAERKVLRARPGAAIQRKLGHLNGENIMNVSELVGKTLSEVRNAGNYELFFTVNDGTVYRMYHRGDCCESVTIEDITGNLDDLVGNPLLIAEEVTHENKNPEGVAVPEYQESFTWTFYKFATIKGYVTVRWYGESNGYYSERVDFEKVP